MCSPIVHRPHLGEAVIMQERVEVHILDRLLRRCVTSLHSRRSRTHFSTRTDSQRAHPERRRSNAVPRSCRRTRHFAKDLRARWAVTGVVRTLKKRRKVRTHSIYLSITHLTTAIRTLTSKAAFLPPRTDYQQLPSTYWNTVHVASV